MRSPRRLNAEEAALWARLAATVKPLRHVVPPLHGKAAAAPTAEGRPSPHLTTPPHHPAGLPLAHHAEDRGRTPPLSATRGLDSSWERKLVRAALEPDFTLDLHGCSLDQAHRRLDSGLMQAKAMGARLVLLITGKPRPADPADRGTQRGAIRAKALDWLAAGPHGSDIAAIRKAHRRHGGEGALYLVLRRPR